MTTQTLYKVIQSGRLYEQIVEQIQARILSGALKVGEQLAPERDLAAQFGVSRTAVREAVKALRQKGLLEIQPGRGTFITNGTHQAVRHSLGLLMKIASPLDSRSLVEVREMLEPDIAALAAERANADNLAAIRTAVLMMEQSLHDPDRFIEADLDFHRALADATQNPLIPVLIDSIVDLLRAQRRGIAGLDGGMQRGQFHHKRILDAVVKQNCERARNAMREHLDQVREDSAAAESLAG